LTRRALRATRVNAWLASIVTSLLLTSGTTPAAAAAPAVAVYQTTPSLSQALTPLPSLGFSAKPPPGVPVIDVNEGVRFQTFEGVGGAMTDSSAWLIQDELAPASRAHLLEELFGRVGIGLSFLRIPIGASDFTRHGRPYSYDGGSADPALSRFSIAHDEHYVIPVIRAALEVNPQLDTLATPWSPPAWMKANALLSNLGERGTLLPSAYGALARYLVKFVKAYAQRGVTIDAITPQNEPGVAVGYPSMDLPEPAEATVIARYAARALHRAGLHTQIYGYDGIWDPSYPSRLARSSAARALAGIAWQCYFGDPSAMSVLHREAPGLQEIVDECSPEIRQFSTTEFEIASLRNWASVVAVWNVALDHHGGPVQEANTGCHGCTGVATIDPATHGFSLGLKYFQLGQVSKFVERGAVRVDSGHLVSYGLSANRTMTVSDGLDDVAFLNPDGTKVLIAYDSSSAPVPFAVQSDGRFFAFTILPGATTTFVWR
jgi:glucosylceramidase